MDKYEARIAMRFARAIVKLYDPDKVKLPQSFRQNAIERIATEASGAAWEMFHACHKEATLTEKGAGI